jgi:hypothetical protein
MRYSHACSETGVNKHRVLPVIKVYHKPGTVVHACNSSLSGSGAREDHGLKPAQAKVSKASISTNLIWWHIPVIPATQEA